MNKSKISKEQILHTSVLYAKEHGIQNMNIRMISTKCNVSIGSIYNYFPTKGDLIIAVMQEFWSHACTHEDIKDINLKDFFVSYPILYEKIYQYLQMFEGNWLHQSAWIDSDTKEKGSKFEREYFVSIKRMIRLMLDYDETISLDVWTSTFNKEAFCDFLFENTLIELNNAHASPKYLLEVLQRLLR